eukprot:jgi/Bigna1/74743/fgenesh1_pg.30_\
MCADNPWDDNGSRKASPLELVLRQLYKCKATFAAVFRKVLRASHVGVFWWKLFDLATVILKREDKSVVESRAGQGSLEKLSALLIESSDVWQSIRDSEDFRDNQVRLGNLECSIYELLEIVRDAISRKRPTVLIDGCIGMTREFWPASLDLFAEALCVNALLNQPSHIVVPSEHVLAEMLANVGEWPSEEKGEDEMPKNLTPEVWDLILERYGPFERLIPNLESVCTTNGRIHVWLTKYVIMEVVLMLMLMLMLILILVLVRWLGKISKGGGASAAPRRIYLDATTRYSSGGGKARLGMAFVLVYKNANHGIDHTPILREAKGSREYYVQGERNRTFPTVRALAADVCQRMGWYSTGYVLKEAMDGWIKYGSEISLHQDRSNKGKLELILGFFPDVKKDPTCPLIPGQQNSADSSSSYEAKSSSSNGSSKENIEGEILGWLDGNGSIQSVTKHLVKTLDMGSTQKEKKANTLLGTTLTQIHLHMLKQAQDLQDLRSKVKELREKVDVYEGKPSAIAKCTDDITSSALRSLRPVFCLCFHENHAQQLKDLLKMEKMFDSSSQKLRKAIEGLYAKTLTFPNEFLCPLTHEVLRDPVITKDGHTYERAAIELWLQRHDTSPLTNMVVLRTKEKHNLFIDDRLDDKVLTPNISLRNSILAFTEKHKAMNSNIGLDDDVLDDVKSQ